DFSLYHGVRNRLWLYVKDTPPLLLWATLPFHLLATIGVWLRAVLKGHAEPVERGLEDAIKGLPDIWRSRRAVQGARRASSGDIAGMMVWSPLDVLCRRGRLRRL
ncbi:MAG: glycosyltransferase family 2 protein, partial [Caulobacteraceae bacterium]